MTTAPPLVVLRSRRFRTAAHRCGTNGLPRRRGLPCRRFADLLTEAGTRLGADVDRDSFKAVDLHHQRLAGLPAHSHSTVDRETRDLLVNLIAARCGASL